MKDGSDATPAAGKVTVTALTATATAGEYTMTLKGTLAGTYTVTPLLNGSAIRDDLKADLTLTAGTTPDGALSTFAASPVSVVADNSAASTLTLVVKDAFGNVIPGAVSGLTLTVKDSQNATPDNTKVVMTALTATGTAGEYTATLKGTLAGAYTVKPLFNGSPLGALSATVTLTAGTTPDGTTSVFAATPDTITADGAAVSSLLLTAKDANGNVISGITTGLGVAVTDSQDATPDTTKVTVSSMTETGTPGLYRATLKGTLTGTYTVKPQWNSGPLGSLSDTVTLTAGAPASGQSTFAAAPDSVTADNTATSTLTLTMKDTNGNAVTGIASRLALEVKDSSDATPADGKVTVSTLSETGATGVYTATLKGTLAGVYTVTPQLDSAPFGTLSDTVTLTTGAPDEGQSTLTVSKASITADNTDTSVLTLTLKDAGGNALSGLTDSLSFALRDATDTAPADGDVVVDGIVETATAGVYTAALKGIRAGVWTVTPQVNSTVVGNLHTTVTLTAGTTPDATQTTFGAVPASVVADNVAMSTLT
ncbi:hypothetical protein D8W73_25575, partial [Citrobacter amalonaticus]|nr:hypothetical protein [Citrobacter amalonaticus]